MCDFDHMYGGKKPMIMPDTVWNKILNYTDELDIRCRFSFSLNYEPFTDPKLYNRLSSLHSRGHSTTVVTNGKLLLQENMYRDYLKTLSKEILISFPGITRELYEKRIDADFSDTVELFKRLYKDLKDTSILVGAAIAIYDVKELQYLSDLIKKLDLPFTLAENKMVQTIFKINFIDSRGSVLKQYMDNKRIRKSRIIDNKLFGLLSLFHSNTYKNLCPFIWTDLCINADGSVPICCWGIENDPNRVIGTVKNTSLKELFYRNLEQVRTPFRMKKPYDKKCEECFKEFTMFAY